MAKVLGAKSTLLCTLPKWVDRDGGDPCHVGSSAGNDKHVKKMAFSRRKPPKAACQGAEKRICICTVYIYHITSETASIGLMDGDGLEAETPSLAVLQQREKPRYLLPSTLPIWGHLNAM